MALLLCFASFGLAPIVAAGETRVVGFDGYDLKSGKLLFKGETTTRTSPGRVAETVRYWNPEGRETQRMEAEYEPEALMPLEYHRDYLLTGEWEAVARDGARLAVQWHARGAQSPKSFDVRWQEGVALSVVVVPHILRARDALQAGQDVVLDLIVPSRQEVYAFRMRQDKPVTIDGQPTWVVRMEPDSFVIRQLVDPLHFFFAADGSGRLIEYRGRSSVQNEKGDGVDARIVYRDPAP